MFNRQEEARITRIELTLAGENHYKDCDLKVDVNIALTDIGGGDFTIAETALDGVILALTDGFNFVLSNQIDAAQNGVYVLTSLLPTTITRSIDITSYSVINGLRLRITGGTYLGNYLKLDTTTPFLINVTPIIVTDTDPWAENIVLELSQRLKNTADDFKNYPTKALPIGNDKLIIEDSENGFIKSEVLMKNLPVSDIVAEYIEDAINASGGATGSGTQFYFTDQDVNVTEKILSKAPDTLAQVTYSAIVNNSQVIIKTYESSLTFGRDRINAGTWEFAVWAKESPISLGKTSLVFEVIERTDLLNENLLFSLESENINSLDNRKISAESNQQQILVSATSKLVVNVYGKTVATNNTTVYFTHSGSDMASSFIAPLTLEHNQLDGIQGGSLSERYHFTQAQHALATQNANALQGGLLTQTDWNTFNDKAVDALVVHLAGTETITGAKTLSGDTTMSSLTADTRLELDALKKVVSVVKKTADNQDFETVPATFKKPSRTPSVGVSNNAIRADAIMPIDSKKQNRIISVASESAMLALGDDEPNNILIDIGNTRVYRTDEQTTYLLTALPASSVGNWLRESGMPQWVSTTAYLASNIIIKQNDNLYRSKSAVPINQSPSADTTEVYWELLGDATVDYVRTMALRSSDNAGGIILAPIASTVTFESGEGNLFKYNSKRSETTVAYTAFNPLTFDVYKRDALYLAGQTAFNSLIYDNAGVITTFGANGDASVAYIMCDPTIANKFAILLGQTVYLNNFATAQARTPFTNLIVPPALSNYKILAKFAYRKDLTGSGGKFSDTSRFYFYPISTGGGSLSVPDASTSLKGIVQLSENYNGTSQTLATTEKALSDGLALKSDKIPNTLAIANLATGGVIGTAVATVDIFEKFNLNQTTAGQSVTLPIPSIATNNKIVYLANVGTVSVIMYGSTLEPNTVIPIIYDTVKGWMRTNSGTGASVMIGATASADGASGLVPKPLAGDEAKFLRGDGTFAFTPSSASTVSFYGFTITGDSNLNVDELPLSATVDVSAYDAWEITVAGLVYSLADGRLTVN